MESCLANFLQFLRLLFLVTHFLLYKYIFIIGFIKTRLIILYMTQLKKKIRSESNDTMISHYSYESAIIDS